MIKPDTATVRYHWHNPQNTIYVALPADGGLTEFLRGLSDTQLSQALVIAAERLAR